MDLLTLRIERDPQFWMTIASHPDVGRNLLGMTPEQVAGVAMQPNVTPLAADNGGFFLACRDALGAGYDVHALFLPCAWGREVLMAAKELVTGVFSGGGRFMVVHEMAGNWRSRPPKSFGFISTAPSGPTAIGECRTWILTRDAWLQSPAARSAH